MIDQRAASKSPLSSASQLLTATVGWRKTLEKTTDEPSAMMMLEQLRLRVLREAGVHPAAELEIRRRQARGPGALQVSQDLPTGSHVCVFVCVVVPAQMTRHGGDSHRVVGHSASNAARACAPRRYCRVLY
jgi:hypothetical protein